MKRTLVLLTAAAVVATPFAASAAPKPVPTKRVVTFDYSGFSAVGHSAGVGLNASGLLPVCTVADSCWELGTVKGEKNVQISADDPSVGFYVWYDGTFADASQIYCGTAKFTVSPKSAHAISVRPALSDCGGVPTEGTFTATILGTK